MRETRTFRWELHRGQEVWSVQDSGATRVAFEEDVDAAREYVSAEIGAEFDGGQTNVRAQQARANRGSILNI
jgi:hypothetical protein